MFEKLKAILLKSKEDMVDLSVAHAKVRNEARLAGETDLKRAEEKAAERLNEFCETAEKVLRENGFSYGASAEIGDSYFETREYEDFTLPAGNYRSLIIRLGEAKGKNWWCVIFPAVCVPAATDASLSDSTRETSAQIAEHPQKYVMRFKTVEIYEDIKKFLKNK